MYINKGQLIINFSILFIIALLSIFNIQSSTILILIYGFTILIFRSKLDKSVFAFIILILSTFHNIRISILGIKIYSDFIMIICLIIIDLIKFFSTRKRISIDLRVFGTYLLCIMFIGISYFFNVYNNVPGENYNMANWLFLSVIESIYVYKSNKGNYNILDMYCLTGIFQSALVIIQSILIPEYVANGTMIEANICSSYIGSIIIIYIGTNIITKKLNFKKIATVLLLITGLVTTITRTSIISTFIIVITEYVILKYISKNDKNRNVKSDLIKVPIFIILSIVLTISLYLFFQNNQLFQYKMQHLLDTDTGTGYYRLSIYKTAIEEILRNIFIGRGSSSFSINHYYDSFLFNLSGVTPFLSNLYISTLYDTGIIGFVILLAIFYIIIKNALSGLSKKAQTFRVTNISLILGLLSLLICFTSTSAFWYSSFWNYIAIILVFTTLPPKINYHT